MRVEKLVGGQAKDSEVEDHGINEAGSQNGVVSVGNRATDAIDPLRRQENTCVQKLGRNFFGVIRIHTMQEDRPVTKNHKDKEDNKVFVLRPYCYSEKEKK